MREFERQLDQTAVVRRFGAPARLKQQFQGFENGGCGRGPGLSGVSQLLAPASGLHTVSREDVLEVLPDAPVAGGGRGKSYGQLPKGVTVNTAPREAAPLSSFAELNLIGRRAEEAVAELDKFLDSAALGGVLRVRVAHGHGMGVLKRAVSELLSTHPHVSKFYAATPQEGGAGATVVELRVED